MFRFSALIISVLISLPATAQDVWFNSVISGVYPLANGSFVITFKDDSSSCPSPAKQYVVKVGENSVTQEGLKLMFGAALAGAAAGKQVHIYFNDSTNSCYINRLRVAY